MATVGSPPTKAAIFVDAENQTDLCVSALMRQFARLDVGVRRAYADWRNAGLDSLAAQLEAEGFDMHHVTSGPRVGEKKDIADGALARGIRQVIANQAGIEVVIIVSGDAFFIPLVSWLQRKRKQVIVAADPYRACRQLCLAADCYLDLRAWAPWVQELDRLERTSKYLTFRYVVRRLSIQSSLLGEMIDRKLVLQDAPRPQAVRTLRLNRQAPVVKLLLDTVFSGRIGLALAG